MTSTAVASYQPSPPDAAPRPEPSAAADALPVFSREGEGADALGRGEAAAVLAEVAVHRRAETPMALGILGPAGSGKSRFLRAVADAASELAAAAGAASAPSPFASRVVAARAEAEPGREPAALLAGAVIAALAEGHAAFAEDAIHAGGDPREAARLAGERVNGLRRSLDAERQTLDGLGARRARLTDTVLFDAAGSRVDAFARANRGRIEARLRAFGLPSTDPVRSYKELVRDNSDPSGGGSRTGLALRALWGFAGQGRLLVLAALLLALGWAAGVGAADPDAVSDWLAGFGDRFTAVTDGARAHLDLLRPVSRIAFALAALAVLADVVRAAQFLGPVFRGIALLEGELDDRRRDLDGLLAHQTRRVDALAAEAETAGRSADAAQRRAEGRRGGAGLSDGGAALADERFGLSRTPDAAAARFFAALSEGMAADGAPERILVSVDGFESLPPPEAAALLAAVHRLLGRPGFVALLALERDTIASALGEFDPALAGARLDRVLQLSYDLGAAPADAETLAERLLDPRVVEDRPRAPVDASRSALDRAFQPFEAEMVKALAPFAGGTPRAVKRFVNAYRVARADPRLARTTPATLGALGLALALDGTAAGGDVAAVDRDLGRGAVTVDKGSDFGRAFAVVQAAVGQEIGGADLRRGLGVARSYGRRG